MRRSYVGTLAALVLVGSGCSVGGGADPAPGACQATVIFEGSRFVARVEISGEVRSPIGQAEKGVCRDVAGSPSVEFDGTGESIEVGSVPGVTVEEAIVGSAGDGSMMLYVAETMSEARASDIEQTVVNG